MPALQVKDFPADLYEKLRLVAARNHRSITQQTIVAVEECIERGALAGNASIHRDNACSNLARRQKVIERIKARAPMEVPEGFPTPEEIIRESRDSR